MQIRPITKLARYSRYLMILSWVSSQNSSQTMGIWLTHLGFDDLGCYHRKRGRREALGRDSESDKLIVSQPDHGSSRILIPNLSDSHKVHNVMLWKSQYARPHDNYLVSVCANHGPFQAARINLIEYRVTRGQILFREDSVKKLEHTRHPLISSIWFSC